MIYVYTIERQNKILYFNMRNLLCIQLILLDFFTIVVYFRYETNSYVNTNQS